MGTGVASYFQSGTREFRGLEEGGGRKQKKVALERMGRALFWTLHFSQKVAPLHSPPLDLPEERIGMKVGCGLSTVYEGCVDALCLTDSKEIQDGSTYHNQQRWRNLLR